MVELDVPKPTSNSLLDLDDDRFDLLDLRSCFLPHVTRIRSLGQSSSLVVGDPDKMSADVLRCGAQVVLPADADGHAAGLDRIQDLGVGAMTFPAAGSATDLALLLSVVHRTSLSRETPDVNNLRQF